MAKIFDTRNDNGELIIVGNSITLPSSAATLTGASEPNLGSMRFNATTNSLEFYCSKNSVKEWKSTNLSGTPQNISDSNYNVSVSDTNVQYTSISSPKTVNLPAANTVRSGFTLIVGDHSGNCSATNTITVLVSGNDTINGATSFVLSSGYQQITLSCNGSNTWYVASSSASPINPAHRINDVDYAVSTSDTNIQYTNITAARKVTLPQANSVKNGTILTVGDQSGNCSNTNTITVQVSGSDLISGASNYVLYVPYNQISFSCDGVGAWTILFTSVGASVTASLDGLLGNQQGSVAFRNASSWTSIPPGTVGQVLKTGGNSANPVWANTVINSANLDSAVGNTSGAIMVRNNTIWTPLAPGTSGQYLLSSGNSTPPVWATVAVPPAYQGRLTLSSNTPVLTSAVNASATLYYTPFSGSLISIWNGTDFLPIRFTELSFLLTNQVASNSIYDIFIYLKNGSPSIVLGAPWTNSTTRATLVIRNAGVMVNGSAIAGGPDVNYGTHVGTILTDASGQSITFNPGGVSSGATAGVIGLWNTHNRVSVSSTILDSGTVSWTWNNGAGTWRPVNNNNNYRVSFITGAVRDTYNFTYSGYGSISSGIVGIGLGLDTIANSTSISTSLPGGSYYTQLRVNHSFTPSIGSHYVQALEYLYTGNSTATFYNTNTATNYVNLGAQGGINWAGLY